MKKNYLIIFSIILFCFIFTGCKKKTYCEKNGHSFSEATCIKPKTCSVCNKIEGTVAKHIIEVKEEVLPTCELEGLSKGSYCTVCNKIFEEQEILKATGHVWVDNENNLNQKCYLCQKTRGAEEVLKSEIDQIINSEVSEKINLPKTIKGYNVSWQSTDKEVVFDDGMIIASDEDRKVSLIATICTPLKEYVIEKEITVKGGIVSLDSYDIAYNFYSSKLNNIISRDVMLLTSEYNGCSVIYVSDDESIITSTGEITQIKVNQYTIMNIYVIKNDIAVLYKHDVEISSFTANKRINETKKLVSEEIEKFRNGEVSVLPIYNEDYEVTITWISNCPEFIMTEDIHLTPLDKTNIKLKAIFSYNTTNSEKTYELENVGGLISEDEFINELIKYMSMVELKGSINHLHPEYNDELFLDYQERINSYGVLNLAKPTSPNVNRSKIIDTNRTDFVNKFYSGLKPTPSQEVLDEVFGTGYQLSNDSNVLFITVHESAMTIAGNNAEYLAQVQLNNAFTNPDAREASWHYQVDAYDIYQSFEDNIWGWHAGKTYGNRYGVGIEMCVNSDGNYEGTLANNAKLVASLMLKYNLNFDNVYRHYDHSGKECPSYLIRTNRWYEFVQMVGKEYLIQKYLKDAIIKYELSTDTYSTTEEVLNKYFITGDNNLYYNKPVSQNVLVNFVIRVIKNNKEYSASSSFMLLPDEVVEE